jgi:hypothetical protein
LTSTDHTDPNFVQWLRAAALAYAARDWPVLPCDPQSKKPLITRGRPPGKLTVTCESFHPLLRNTLRGFAEILIAELRLKIRDIAKRAPRCGPPSRARWSTPFSRAPAAFDEEGTA